MNMTRFFTALVILVGGATLTLTAFLMTKIWEKEIISAALARDNIACSAALQTQIELHLMLSRSLLGLFTSSEQVSRDEFNRFADTLIRNSTNIIAVGWLPRIRAEERDQFAKELKSFRADHRGLWEFNASAEPVEAGPRKNYFPVFYTIPFESTRRLLGFDVSSVADASAAMETARDSADVAVAAEIRPAIEGQQEKRFVTFLPYYTAGRIPQSIIERRETLQGFLVSSHKIESILSASLSASGEERINLYLFDQTDRSQTRFLYAYGKTISDSPTDLSTLLGSGAVQTRDIKVGNRTWLLAVEATPAYSAAKKTWQPFFVLITGTLISLLLVAFIDKILTSSQRARQLAQKERDARKLAEEALAEQHRTEVALRESEQRFRAIFNNSYQFTGLLKTDGTLIDANDTALAFINADKSEVIDKPFWESGWWGHSDELCEQLKKAIAQAATGKQVLFVATHLSARDQIHTVEVSITPIFDEQGQVQLLIPEGRDISERIEMEQKLEASEKDLRMLLEQSPIGLRLCTLDGQIVEANPAFSRIIGYTIEEILQLNVIDITPSEYALEERDSFIYQLNTTGSFGPYEKEYIHKDGHLVPVRINGILLERRGEKFFWASIEDITALKASEKEAQLLTEQLIQAQKIEAIGTLASGIAHDFNNILSAILGFAELTLRNASCDPATEKNLGFILSATNRGRDLVRQILMFSRKENETQEAFTVAPIVEETYALLRQMIPSSISISLDAQEQVGKIAGDKTQIQQVIMNLCTNAFHAMPDSGGQINIGLKQVKLDGTRATGKNLPHGEYALITVADNGSGIPEQIISQIFDPFFTTKERERGTGLGLSVVHGIVKRHGGTIEVESTVGKGSTFFVFLPVSSASNDADSHEEHPLETGHGDERILFIDDEPMLKELGQLSLETFGYQVTATTSAKEALELFSDDPSAFDLIITDQTMPEMTGTDLTRKALSIRPDIPIIICTGDGDKKTREKALSFGARALLAKPVRINELVREIRKFLG